MEFTCSRETGNVVPALESSGHERLALEGVAEEPAALAERWDGGVDLLIVDHYAREAASVTSTAARNPNDREP